MHRLSFPLLLLLLASPALAQRDLKNIPPPDPEEERKTFILGPGLEVNLYAADPLLQKPIHMNFDAAGRLWVAASEVYPQIKPGQKATDKIIVLEDANGDGTADKTTVFADGLLIPTGVAPGDGGAYVANSTELLHLVDADGDGKADRSRVVLSGFGTEDTHHILHSFRWGVEGLLYMNQSIYIHSHIETPYGVKRLDGGGIWRFRPETYELDVLCKGFVNTWGHEQDRWGQSFATDGAFGEGINYTFPGGVFCTSPGAKRILKGLNPGSPKHCGLEIVSGRHFPPEWSGSMITNDFRAHRVCRFTISENASGYASRQETEIIKSNHVAFRPIDAKIGPDGALYIADWYNPIIQHGEVDFRDERRDHTHGRIWRVTYKGRPLVERPQIVGANIPVLLDMLRAPEDFTRLHAKRELKGYGRNKILPLLAEWATKLDPKEADYDHHRLEALWTYQHFDALDDALLESLLTSSDHKVRAAAVRALSLSKERATNVMGRLERAVEDKHPRVRLEAVRALAVIPGTRSAEIAAKALDQPLDEWLDFGLWQAFRDLEPQWLPALREGKLDFGGKVERLTFALKAVEAPGMVGPLMTLLKEKKVPADRLEGVLTLIATLGGPAEMGTIVDLALAEKPEGAARQRALLDALVAATQARKTVPAGDLSRLGTLLDSPDESLRASAARALGTWKVAQARPALIALAQRKNKESDQLHQAGIDGLAALGDGEAIAVLRDLAAGTGTIADRTRAVIALASHDIPTAAAYAAAVLGDSKEEDDPSALILAIAERKAGPPSFIESLQGRKLRPDVAKRAVRAVSESLRPLPELSAALRKAGGLAAGGTKLSAEEVQAVLRDVAATGNAARGELVYRRKDLGCIRCHAIAGAGGRVGPDLVSIGASAPVDYLLDSLVDPNAKVKEGFHSKILELADGRVLTGIIVRETPKEVVIRDATDAELTLQPANIEARNDGRSLMPDGVIDALTRSELVDLTRFLAELGKVGPYAVGQARVVRRWQSLVWTAPAHQVLNRTSFDSAAGADPAFTWEPAYSTVGGLLPLDGAAKFKPHGDVTPPTSFVRFEIEATAAGPVELRLNSTTGLTAWFDGKPAQAASAWKLDLPQGRHTVTLAVDRNQRTDPLRIELVDIAGSTARAELVTGK